MSLQEIQKMTLDILSRYLRPGDRVAIVDFPNHGNSGDSLIYLGELEYLRKLGVHIDYVADASRYSVDDLRRRVPSGPILIHGGGNFGDRWLAMQEMRERVVADFPDRHIIQLPQSIEFSPGPVLERAQRVLSSHQTLTLLIRDSAGVARARELFPSANVAFCPDMAFGYGFMNGTTQPIHDVVVLKRGDSESVQERIVVEASGIEDDWGLSGWRRVLAAALRGPGALIKKAPALGNKLYPVQRYCYDQLAGLHVKNAVRILSRGQVIVTDRLHAAVIAGLMGKPAVAINNANGKIAAIHSEYLNQLPGIHYATSLNSANEIVKTLLHKKS